MTEQRRAKRFAIPSERCSSYRGIPGSIFSCIKDGGGIKVEKIKQNAFVKKVGLNRILLIGVLILMYLLFGALTSGDFFGMTRILNIMNYAYFLGFLSLGVTFVIATGGIDFSIGPVMFCCSLVSGYCLTTYGFPMPVSLILSILLVHYLVYLMVVWDLIGRYRHSSYQWQV